MSEKCQFPLEDDAKYTIVDEPTHADDAGSKHAIDIVCKPGSKVVADSTGTVVRAYGDSTTMLKGSDYDELIKPENVEKLEALMFATPNMRRVGDMVEVSLEGKTQTITADAFSRMTQKMKMGIYISLITNAIVLEHEGGIFSSYAHIGNVSVKKGDRVEQGQVIAETARTGCMDSDHLHYQRWKLDGEVPATVPVEFERDTINQQVRDAIAIYRKQ